MREFAEVETPWGEVRDQDRALAFTARSPTRRLNTRIAARSPREHSVPLKQVMQEAMRAYAHARGMPQREGALMDRSQIEALLNEVREGRTDVADALERLRNLPFEDMGFAKLDHHRALRTGMPEVIFADGQDPGTGGRNLCAHGKGRRQCAGHARLARNVSRRCSRSKPRAEYHEAARAITLMQTRAGCRQGNHRRGLRRHQRSAGCRRSRGDRAADGQHSGAGCGCGRGGHSSPAGAAAHAPIRARARLCAPAWKARCRPWSGAWSMRL